MFSCTRYDRLPFLVNTDGITCRVCKSEGDLKTACKDEGDMGEARKCDNGEDVCVKGVIESKYYAGYIIDVNLIF